MRLIKNEVVRFFGVGFAGGALLVAATMGFGATGVAATAMTVAHHIEAAR